ncbi:hypothetical protein D7M15_12920 [Streptomyces sp. Z26]|nr:hypothetical protein D7M15_12920 [Streptomyces sp. Z26]
MGAERSSTLGLWLRAPCPRLAGRPAHRVSNYTATGGTPTVLFDSGNDLPDSLSVNTGAHTHVKWGFDGAGTYKATFQVTN